MNLKIVGYIVLVVGVTVALVALLADSLGLGDPEIFGPVQIIMLVVGIVLAVVGVYLGFVRKEEAAQTDTE